MIGVSIMLCDAQGEVDRLSIVPETATIDKFGHIYYANVRQDVIKVDLDGQKLGFYSNNRLGNISLIDASNPLKVLVYFPEFLTGVMLDRQINETGQFDMINLGFGQIDLVATALNSALWIFNSHQQRIYQIDHQGQILITGEDLRLRFNARLEPSKIKEHNGRLFMSVPDHGMLIFDQFGNFETQFIKTGIKDFQLSGNLIIYRLEDKMEVYDFTTFETKLFDVAHIEPGQKLLWIAENHVAIVSPTGITKQLLQETN